MTQSNRLTTGGRIDRSKPLRFTFHGRTYQGFAGDTLASALLANGVKVTARSFKYHRPRGIMGHGVEEPATLVELAEGANHPATMVPLEDGLEARAVNCWPSPEFDFGAVAQTISKLIPAGFYYKTFMWPDWHLFEPSIRRAAGLAGAPTEPPNGRYENRYTFCDILVVGAGPAGLQAALDAGRSGKRVLLVDEGLEPGGSLLNQSRVPDFVSNATAELVQMPNVIHLQSSTAWGYREHNLVLVTERCPDHPSLIERTHRVRAGQVILATGAIERMLVFPGNDRPGVMLASAVKAYVNRYAVAPGKRVAIFTNNSSAYTLAEDLKTAGLDVAAVIDSRSNASDATHKGVVTKVRGARGVKAVQLSTGETVACDLLAVSGGWSPAVHLWSQSRGTLRYDPALAAFLPDQPAQNCQVVGAANGHFSSTDEDASYDVEPLWHVDAKGKAFLDILNDVTVDDIQLALREGYDNIEHVKRYTTAGMALDQGKTGNVNVIGTVAKAQNRALEDVGTTTFRSPYTPVSFGAIGGVREDSVLFPYRHTPLTNWNKAQGAVMYEAGARWQRPGYFPQPGETMQDAINRESLAVRDDVGVYDGSPLGTFELKGRDAGRFLDLICTNIVTTLKPGQVRYVMMLSDDGLIIDDGVALRLGEHRWLLSTSTGHADAMNQHMEMLRQTEVPDWNVRITTVTSQWNNATLCGPKARDVLKAVGTDIDLSPNAFPFMSFRDGRVAGVPARVVRVSFTGEMSFEINVAPRHLLDLWLKIMEHNVTPVGSEANHVLRVEKGFLSLGHEVDGTVDAIDLGMGWILSKKKDDYWGKRAVALRRARGTQRQELVGLLPEPDAQIPEGAPLTPGGRKEASEGLVTACVWSVVHSRWVALALLRDGRSRIGDTAHVRVQGKVMPVTVTQPCFHDADGIRLRS